MTVGAKSDEESQAAALEQSATVKGEECER